MGIAAQRVIQPQRTGGKWESNSRRSRRPCAAAKLPCTPADVSPTAEVEAAAREPDAAEVVLVADVLGQRGVASGQHDVVVVLHPAPSAAGALTDDRPSARCLGAQSVPDSCPQTPESVCRARSSSPAARSAMPGSRTRPARPPAVRAGAESRALMSRRAAMPPPQRRRYRDRSDHAACRLPERSPDRLRRRAARRRRPRDRGV